MLTHYQPRLQYSSRPASVPAHGSRSPLAMPIPGMMDTLRVWGATITTFPWDELFTTNNQTGTTSTDAPPPVVGENLTASDGPSRDAQTPLPTSPRGKRSFWLSKGGNDALDGAQVPRSEPRDVSSGVSSDAGDADDDEDVPIWAFWTSRYGISAIVMAVLLNRIQHICRPRGRPVRLGRWKRLFLRLPALVALIACNIVLAIRVVQTWSGGYVLGQNRMADYIATHSDVLLTKERRSLDTTLLWMTYIACCLSIATDAVTRTLEGGHDPPSALNLINFGLTMQMYSQEPPWVLPHYFLYTLLEIGELTTLSVMNTFGNRYLRRLPVTTFFGLAGALHFLVTPSHRSPLALGFNAVVDLTMIGFLLVTIALHAFTMLITEGKVSGGASARCQRNNPLSSSSHPSFLQIDPSRLLFSPSNLPSIDDDYSTAILKLGVACLRSTRLVGLSREVITIEIPEKTYVELDEGTGARLKLGIDELLSGSRERGFKNEVRLTNPISQRRSERYEAVFLPSTAKWREIKRFALSLVSIIGTLWRAAIARLPSLPFPLPEWLRKMPRRLRLLWHGQNGERRREERIAKREAEKAKEREQAEALTAALRRGGAGIGARPGESSLDAAWRALNDLPTPAAQGDDGDDDYDEDDDAEWLVDDNDSEAEDDGGANVDGLRRRYRYRSQSQTPTPESEGLRSRSRSRSIMSPSPAPSALDEDEIADESVQLIRAARRDFDEKTPTPEDGGSGQQQQQLTHGALFNQVLMAHVASGDGTPLTRSRFRALVPGGQSLPAGAAGDDLLRGAGSFVLNRRSDDQEASDAHLRDVILRRRREVLRLTESGEDEERLANRDRQRACVVCCYEER